ncbi:MAG: MgtC/SapB family protein [Bacillota bacterium]|jgi:putative Mg2+ transporter-C (MgtC) family protein|nr:MgtC/SapB family protein [Bacillota bacterium]MDD3297298.1 MgtC/SapB family protein [Bacillota bacterium]MDD3850799.1 MgtC/SapB family protein [Bacillota bacterium]MDD4706814.1 MgtC/SapB family protein [Bacillota bacterium]
MLSGQEVLLRILLAFILSSVIGMEREFGNQAAGLRTHILVCVGSTLVMLVSFHLFEIYGGQTSMDPARLGAQVISGIGFLGAGTIMKEGASIRGLTTAAGLWVVACIGLAVGAGFYLGSVLVTAVIVITLTIVNRLEKRINKSRNTYSLTLRAENIPGQLGRIGSALGKRSVSIINIKMIELDDFMVEIILLLKPPGQMELEEVVGILHEVEGIKQIVDSS